jgi:glycosyltransferase involved in cell wall biosynthesis
MKVSIITVAYNAEKTLEQTICSVLRQTHPQIEYLIIDGHSTDNTMSIVRQYEAGITRWLSEPDTGLYDAMNKGLQMATGDYVWFLNAGDTLQHSDTVARLVAVAENSGMPDILYGETDLVDSGGQLIAARRLKAPAQLTWKSFRFGMLVCHQSFIVRRTLAPLYNLQYRYSADFDWCIRCMKAAANIVNTHLRPVNYLYEGLTTANRKASLRERYVIMCRYYGVFVTAILHVWFAARFYWAKLTKKAI